VQVTPASDIFCLGAVLAYAATGRMPFGTADSGVHALLFRIAEEEPELSGLSGPLRDLVAHCLAKDPAARPGLDALASLTEGELSGTWLPGEVLAQLGRHAVQLLDSEDPEGDATPQATAGAGASASAPSTPPPSYGPPSGVYGPPTSAPYTPPSPPQPWQQQGGYGYPGAGPGPGPGTPPPTGPSRPARSARKLAQTLTVLLSLALVMGLIRMIVHFMVDDSLGDENKDLLGQAYVEDIDGFHGLKSATLALEFVSIPLGVSAIVTWSMWWWRVRLNAETFAPGRIRYGQEMAVGAWFIPVCNLFVPKQVINDVWSVSNPAVAPWYGYGPRPSSRRGLVNGWWWTWICYFCIGFIGNWENWFNADDVSSAEGTIALALFTDFLGIPAAILALMLVLRLTSLQDDHIASRPH
ncbi:MAG: DUF4328 domain-containing protein, partial [Streptomyces sp.]